MASYMHGPLCEDVSYSQWVSMTGVTEFSSVASQRKEGMKWQ